MENSSQKLAQVIKDLDTLSLIQLETYIKQESDTRLRNIAIELK
jgi:hypothetical protein